MKPFKGLLTMEHRHNSVTYIVLAVLNLLVVCFAPYAISYYVEDTVAAHVRFTLSVPLAVMNLIAVIVLFVVSLNRDIKNKEIWLHSTSSIYTLVGVKVIYHALALIVIEACAFTSLLFSGNLVQGTILQYGVLAFVATVVTMLIYMAMVLFVYFFTVLYLQGTRYLGKFSIVLLMLAMWLYFEVMNVFPDMAFIRVGQLNFTWLVDYMPKMATTSNLTVQFLNIYVVEELVATCVFAALFIGTSKWLERVLTR